MWLRRMAAGRSDGGRGEGAPGRLRRLAGKAEMMGGGVGRGVGGKWGVGMSLSLGFEGEGDGGGKGSEGGGGESCTRGGGSRFVPISDWRGDGGVMIRGG